MKKIRVHLKENSYDIYIGTKIWSELPRVLASLQLPGDAVVVTNTMIGKLYGRLLRSSIIEKIKSIQFFEVPDRETSKSFIEAKNLIEKIADYGLKKKIFIIALGGGVIGDLAGFVASIYKRGIPYIQVPTTFLAQIDSAIGGKVGIDLAIGKNLVGSFYQPRLVWCDLSVLSTLSQRQMCNGLAECIKYGTIRDKYLFQYIERHLKKILELDLRCLEYVVHRCTEIKVRVVEEDEKEKKGLRSILNYGHTIGHAIETATHYRFYYHGEAITLGMRVAGNLAQRLNLLKRSDRLRIERLLTSAGLPQKIKQMNPSGILRAMASDKKFKSGKNRFVLATQIGKVKVVEQVPRKFIHEAIKEYL